MFVDDDIWLSSIYLETYITESNNKKKCMLVQQKKYYLFVEYLSGTGFKKKKTCASHR